MPRAPYSQPIYLDDIFLIDILELCGSQHAASAFLAISQSTISRALSRVRAELDLDSASGSVPICRIGRNACLDLLRLASRAHRFMKGFIRIGSDPLHDSLLSGLDCVEIVPSRFRKQSQWVELIRYGVLDAAIISSLGMDRSAYPGPPVGCDDMDVFSLGNLPLYLMSNAQPVRGALVPRRAVAPVLHSVLEGDGFDLVVQPRAAQSHSAWLKRMRDRNLALPLSPILAGERWLSANGLNQLPNHSPLLERLWLITARDDRSSVDVQRVVNFMSRRLRRRL